MNSVIHIILVCEITCEFYLNSFKSLALPLGTGHVAAGNPVLPSDILNVGAICYSARDIRRKDIHIDCFKTLAFACSSGFKSVTLILGFPSVVLTVNSVKNRRRYTGLILRYNHNLKLLKSLALACSTCEKSAGLPTLRIAVILNMNTIHYNVVIGEITCKLHLYGFKSETLAVSTGRLTGIYPVSAPSDILNMYFVLKCSGIRGIVCKIHRDALKPFALPACSQCKNSICISSVLVSDILNVSTSAQCKITGRICSNRYVYN